MQEDQAKRVAGVEVPELVELETVEERAARRGLAEEPDSRRACGPASPCLFLADVGLREQRPFDRQRGQAVALDQSLDGRVDPRTLSVGSPGMADPPPPVGTLLDLTGRIAIVTGASGNIGAGIARRLHEAGATVVAHAHRDLPAAEALVAELGDRAVSAVGDVQRDASAICAIAVDAFGRLDIVVNNAGIQPVAPLESIGDVEFVEMLRVNVAGVAAMTREAASAMGTGGGAIVNISSIEGLQPAFDHSHYAAAKAAVIMHTRAAALELGPVGIRVNSVSPGMIEAPAIAETWPEGVARWLAAAPLERLGTPSDVADAVVFLVSPASRWISGANLVVDGGVLAHNTW